MPHAPKEDIQKSQNFEFFFKKGGLRGSKMIFLKKYFQNRKGLQKLDTKNVPHAPKEYFQKNKKIFFFQKRGLRGSKKLKKKIHI